MRERECDDVSKMLWRDLRKAEENPSRSPLIRSEETYGTSLRACCKVVKAALDAGCTTLSYLNISIPIQYCPNCGRSIGPSPDKGRREGL